MSTISKAHKVDRDDFVCQGDIFKDVSYVYMSSEDGKNVNLNEMIFPFAVVVSQACDVKASDDMIVNKRGKITKFMPSVLMCPIYDEDLAKRGAEIEEVVSNLGISLDEDKDVFTKQDIKISNKDWHYRLHKLEVKIEEKMVLEKAVIDFKHYFTVPPQYLRQHINSRVFRLENIFAEQITLKFATYLSRVAIPEDITIVSE